jgi:glycosyltransferase involved in cell wall biosynthesis
VESSYYRQLFKTETGLFRKMYYLYESMLLRRYEAALPDALPVFCICEKDAERYRKKLSKTNVSVLPAFIPCSEITSAEGMGNFCLYHGNLSVAENEKAALWLLEKVFTKIKVPFVVAGKNPSRRLQAIAHLCQHTCIVANPGEKEMNDLVAKAHIHVLPSFNTTGIKLKLLAALCRGKHCIANDEAVQGTGLEPLCHVATTAEAFASVIAQLYHQPFTEEEIRLRNKVIWKNFNNRKNAQQLIQHLW